MRISEVRIPSSDTAKSSIHVVGELVVLLVGDAVEHAEIDVREKPIQSRAAGQFVGGTAIEDARIVERRGEIRDTLRIAQIRRPLRHEAV